MILTGIGNSTHPFTGEFEGDGAKIMNVNKSMTHEVGGLIDYAQNAKITNIIFENHKITSSFNTTGGVVGSCKTKYFVFSFY